VEAGSFSHQDSLASQINTKVKHATQNHIVRQIGCHLHMALIFVRADTKI